MKKMAQTTEKRTTSKNHLEFNVPSLVQTQAPEVLMPQVQVIKASLEQDESQSIKKKLRKVFNKIKLNAKITQEVKCINALKANVDTRILGYRNNLINF